MRDSLNKKTSTDEGSLWRQVSQLRPGLRSNIRVSAQDYRGQRWYLLHDESSGGFLRVNSSAYAIIGRFDSDQSVEEIVESINSRLNEEERLSNADVLKLIVQLHEAEVIQGGLTLSTRDALRRHVRQRSQQHHQRWSNPLSLRFPFLDPDKILERLQPISRVVFSATGLFVWLLVLVLTMTVLSIEYENLALDIGKKSFGVQEVFSLLLLYPLIKALHELGHGMAIKCWGGEVHEAGVFLLVLLPVPYVDGSASWAFREKHKRVVVASAGILVELLLACIGILIWSATEPGLVNDIALNTALIGGLSTLLYNGNPLLRFDGYYVLEDLVEIPNLSSRSSRYYVYLIQRYILRVSSATSPVSSRGEKPWLLAYGLLSPLYRLVVLVGIALYLSGKYLIVGVVLACWAVGIQIIKPVFLALLYLARDPEVRARRVQTTGALMIPGFIVVGFLLAPMPLTTRTEGVVWIEDQGRVTAQVDGVVTEVIAESGSSVRQGDSILVLENKVLATSIDVLRARQKELQALEALERTQSRVRGEMAAVDLQTVTRELRELMVQQAALRVLSPSSGSLVFNDPHEMTGKFISRGDTIAFVVGQQQPTVRGVIDQSKVGNFRAETRGIEVMLSDQLGKTFPAEITRHVPAGSYNLPSSALGGQGGGAITVDLSDQAGLTAQSEIFQFDLTLPEGVVTSGIGGRAYIKLNHGYEALWRQWSRAIRQLLLSRLAV